MEIPTDADYLVSEQMHVAASATPLTFHLSSLCSQSLTDQLFGAKLNGRQVKHDNQCDMIHHNIHVDFFVSASIGHLF